MPPKRRLSTSESPDGDENDGSATKRKKLDEPSQMQAVVDFIKKFQKRSGGLLCEIFMKIPGKLIAPGYAEVVKNPITIPQIQQKTRAGEYPSIEEFTADFNLLVNNAKSYYVKESHEYRITLELENLLAKSLEAVANGDELSPSIVEKEEDVLTEFLEELLGTVMTASDASEPDRSLSAVFQLLPSKRRYPEYYKVTSQPIDLKIIASKIQDGEYSSIGQMEEDLQLMFRNATNFNEPGSIIYKDARFLSKQVKSKKAELDVSLQAKQNRGARSSRRQSKQVYSSQLISLQYEDSEEEEDEEEEEVLPTKGGPLWDVYNAVRNYVTPAGAEIAEVFLSLPSRRELPDYYQTILEPISLNQIKRNIRSGEYNGSVQLLAKDMDKMFENCKEYNRPDSKLYKDGAKLQKVMRSKVEELEGEDVEELAPVAAANTSVDDIKMKSPRDPKEQIRKRCKTLYNAILNYTNTENERPIGAFMEKPDRKSYPDYYDIITEPMDMKTINDKIMTSFYKSEDDMLADCKIMFSNCRMYNEEGSEIYTTANTLEKVLFAKAKEMGIISDNKIKKRRGSLMQKIKTLYDTLKDYRDAKGRQLSLIFLKLPSKHEYPDYYDIIKRPIDMEKISGKLRNNVYENLEDAISDFTLVFDNACKYNEPDSQIYKDAQTLQRLAHQTVRHLTEDDGVPDAKTAVQDILSNIYHTVFTAQDGEERCLADSFAELSEHDEINGKKVRALSLEIIKRRTDRGLYKRLDLLQRDVFSVLTRARKISRLDSQIWEDSVELQRIFIRARDQYGEKGARLLSKVYEYTQEKLDAEVEVERAGKASEPAQPEEEEDKMNESGAKDWSGEMDSAESSQFHVGDFVYVTPDDPGMDPHIYHIERLFEREGGSRAIWARQFFMQRETFHVPNRTFFEKEVMQGDIHNSVPISKVMGKCIVMAHKDYFKMKPEGFDEKDIYVCEWRYTSKIRNWKKIKPSTFWDYPAYIKMTPRDKPLEPKRVASVFKDRIEKHKEEVEEIEALEKVVEEPIPPNVKWFGGPDLNLTYWEQYTIPGPITVRRGDHVLVRGEGNRNMVAQIDTMWMGPDGMAYFNGPWFVVPAELPPQPDRKFFKAEAFLSTISDSNPLLSVVGKCIVLEFQDFCKQRQTQYNEDDVYICESLFDEAKRLIRPLPPGGLKKYAHSPHVYTDEIYFFPELLTPEKESINTQPAPTKTELPMPVLDMNEDSMDAPSVGSVESASFATPMMQVPIISASPSPGPKRKERKKTVTAYILFSMDQRRITMDENPGVKFGEISRTIAEKWKQLTEPEKRVYQERAKKYNIEKEAEENEKNRQAEIALANAARNNPPPPAGSPGLQHMGGPGSPGQRMRQDSGGASNMTNGGMMQVNGGQQHMQQMQPGPPNLRADPLFHVVPPKPQRILHSEAYIKYIEGLSKDTKTMCNWDKQLQATSQGARTDESKLPASWLSSNGEHTTSTEALWALRDFMMHESLGVVRIM